MIDLTAASNENTSEVIGTSTDSHQSHRVLCGAMTRMGTPCKAKAIPGKKRCKLHGGMSTGPRTPEGKAIIAEAQRRRWAKTSG